MARDMEGRWFEGAPCFTPAADRKCFNCLFWGGRLADTVKELSKNSFPCNDPRAPRRPLRQAKAQFSGAHGCGNWEMIQELPAPENTQRMYDDALPASDEDA